MVSTPKTSRRVFTKSIVCGLHFSEINTLFALELLILILKFIASQAAVASSNKEAFAISIPVISIISC